jgi:hypothetical protein
MKGWFVLLTLAACGAGDDTAAGRRGRCATGGALNDCPDTAATAEAACWRLVDCAAIPLSSDDQGTDAFDWGKCVDYIQRSTDDAQRLIVECISAASCDALKPQNPGDPNPGEMRCLRIGGR